MIYSTWHCFPAFQYCVLSSKRKGKKVAGMIYTIEQFY